MPRHQGKYKPGNSAPYELSRTAIEKMVRCEAQASELNGQVFVRGILKGAVKGGVKDSEGSKEAASSAVHKDARTRQQEGFKNTNSKAAVSASAADSRISKRGSGQRSFIKIIKHFFN